MIGSFKQESPNSYRCNFGPGYGDIMKPLAACQHFAHIHDTNIMLNFYTNLALDKKIKDSDPETIEERFFYIYDNLKDNRITCNFYKTADCGCHHHICNIVSPEPQWWFNDMWNTTTPKTCITVQINEPALLSKFDSNKIAHTWRVNFRWNEIIDYLAMYNLPIVLLDYTLPISQVHQTLLQSAFHVGYSGSSTHLAFAVGTPVILISDLKEVATRAHSCGYSAFSVQEFLTTNFNINSIIRDCVSSTDQQMQKYSLERK